MGVIRIPEIRWKGKEGKGGAYWKLDGLEIGVGREMLGPRTIIFNPGGSAHTCPAADLGLCQMREVDECYAYQDEIYRTGALAFRERQRAWFESHTGEQLGETLIDMLSRGQRFDQIQKLRISESGDLRSQSDLEKIALAARIVKAWYRSKGRTLIAYGYSARSDLDFTGIEKSIVFKGSGHDKCCGRCDVIEPYQVTPPGYHLCNKKCATCSLCAVPWINIAFHFHGNAVVMKRHQKRVAALAA